MEDKAASHNFLSMIFGIFGFFWLEICGRKKFRRKIFDRKHFRSKKINFRKIFFRGQQFFLWKSQWTMKNSKFWFFDEKIEILKFSFFIDFFIGFFWSRKNIFRKNIFSIEIFFGQIFFDDFFFRSHIWIQKVIKIPKITLRKLFDEAWCSIQPLR